MEASFESVKVGIMGGNQFLIEKGGKE